MAKRFGSFYQSPLGGFIKSPLGVRGVPGGFLYFYSVTSPVRRIYKTSRAATQVLASTDIITNTAGGTGPVSWQMAFGPGNTLIFTTQGTGVTTDNAAVRAVNASDLVQVASHLGSDVRGIHALDATPTGHIWGTGMLVGTAPRPVRLKKFNSSLNEIYTADFTYGGSSEWGARVTVDGDTGRVYMMIYTDAGAFSGATMRILDPDGTVVYSTTNATEKGSVKIAGDGVHYYVSHQTGLSKYRKDDFSHVWSNIDFGRDVIGDETPDGGILTASLTSYRCARIDASGATVWQSMGGATGIPRVARLVGGQVWLCEGTLVRILDYTTGAELSSFTFATQLGIATAQMWSFVRTGSTNPSTV